MLRFADNLYLRQKYRISADVVISHDLNFTAVLICVWCGHTPKGKETSVLVGPFKRETIVSQLGDTTVGQSKI